MSSGAHLLSKLTMASNAVSVSGNHSRCFVISELRDTRLNKITSTSSCGYNYCRDYSHYSAVNYSRCRDGTCFCDVHSWALSPCFTAACASPSHGATQDADSDSDSDREPDPDPGSDRLLGSKMVAPKDAVPVPSGERLDPESWMLIDGEDVPTVVSSLPLTQRYAPRRLLEFVSKKLDSKMFSPAQLKSALMFWQKKQQLQKGTSFASSAFGEKGVSQIYQWTATELTLQHAQLTRIARDILYFVLACSLLGIVRVLEALLATFSSSPPHYSRLLDAANSLDFFTMAFLAYGLRKPVIGILRVDPTNLDEVVQLKAKIWDEMHKFHERQWKLVATLAVGRLLALVAQKLPSTNAMTRNIKMCWDFLLALPIF